MRFQLSDPTKTEQLAIVYMLTAYERCGNELGMGFLRAVNDMDAVTIRNHIHTKPSYFNGGWLNFSGDYIAGRMVRTDIEFEPTLGLIHIPDSLPSPDDQGWAAGVPTDPNVLRSWTPSAARFYSYYALLMVAAVRVGVSLTEVKMTTT